MRYLNVIIEFVLRKGATENFVASIFRKFLSRAKTTIKFKIKKNIFKMMNFSQWMRAIFKMYVLNANQSIYNSKDYLF